MKTQSLIITLIQNDLKHHQLLANLEHQLGVEKDTHHLELLDVVHDLMRVPPSAEFDFGKTYCNYMNIASWFPLEATSENLRNQARMCYKHLRAIVEVESVPYTSFHAV